MIEMVEDRDDLGNAIALNSSMVNAARLLGPSIAGVVIAAVGEGYCFLIDGISYIAVIVSLLAMRIAATRAAQSQQTGAGKRSKKDGATWRIRAHPFDSSALALVSLVGMPYTVLMPIFAGGAARRPAYAGIPDGRIGRGRAHRRNVPGDAKKRARPGTQ